MAQVRVMVSHYPKGRGLESLFGLGESHGQSRPTGQAVRVMVWLGLESWSDTFEFFGEGV